MPKSVLGPAAALAVALSLAGTGASAENHIVMIMDGGYFPTVTYAGPGDNFVFLNETTVAHVMNGPDNAWVSDPIEPGARFVLNLTHNTPLVYHGTAVDGTPIEGALSYDPAPLSD